MKTIIIDIETSGLVPKGATYETDYMKFPWILSIAWKINNEPTKEFIINQEDRIVPPEATKINGITQEMVNSSPHRLQNVLVVFALDCVNVDHVIGYNLYFDTSIIKANVLKMWHPDGLGQYTEILHKDKRIDCMRICAKLWGGKWPTLSEAYFNLFADKFEAHSAGADVEACYRIYLELYRRGLIPVKIARGVDI